jgi:hypothetical protein
MTVCGGLVWPGRASQLAPVSPSVRGVSAMSPEFTMQVALTMTSSVPHMAGFAIPPSSPPRTTRNCGGGDTPSRPSFPGGPAGPCGPGAPACPGGPASPRSPLSPLSPFTPQALRTSAEDRAASTKMDFRISTLNQKRARGNARLIFLVPRKGRRRPADRERARPGKPYGENRQDHHDGGRSHAHRLYRRPSMSIGQLLDKP